MTPVHVRTATIMGLPWSIRIRPRTDLRVDARDVDEAADRVWAVLHRYDRIFSPYRADSDLNAVIADPTVWVDPEFDEVMAVAAVANRATGGLFDVRGAGRLDPSGIVKGWAAQRAACELQTLGADFYLNGGGDLSVHTEPGADQPWRIGIEHPADPHTLLTVVSIRNGAVATSGSAHRGAHLWDPRTGEAAPSTWQATVIGPLLTWADILATAAAVAGPDQIDRTGWPPGYEVLFARADGTGIGPALADRLRA